MIKMISCAFFLTYRDIFAYENNFIFGLEADVVIFDYEYEKIRFLIEEDNDPIGIGMFNENLFDRTKGYTVCTDSGHFL